MAKEPSVHNCEGADLSLFETPPEEGHSKATGGNPPPLRVVDARYLGSSEESFKGLLDGYSSMRVLTYSNSLSVIGLAARLVDRLEVVFGREDIVRGLGRVSWLQQELLAGLNREAKEEDALERKVVSGDARFFVLKDAVSHAKVFLLEGERGTRVLTGSANFSETALSGRQRENIERYDDDPGAWEYYSALYDEVLRSSALVVPKEAVLADKVGPEHLVFFSEGVEGAGGAVPVAGVVDLPVGEAPEGRPPRADLAYRVVAAKLPSRFEGLNKVVPQKDGVARLDARTRTRVVSHLKNRSALEQDGSLEHLSVDHGRGRVVLSGEELDLSPPAEDVRRDAALLLEHFGGYRFFRGDPDKLARDYFTFMSWLYAAPYVCDFRNGAQARGEQGYEFPVFGVLYGKSGCGKSLLVQALLASMFRREESVSNDLFTEVRVAGLREQSGRYPLVFDDLKKKRFTDYAAPLIKTDYLTSDDYPVVVLSMNNQQDAFDDDVRKRALMIYAGTSMPSYTAEASELSKQTARIRGDLGDAFYRAYLSRALTGMKRGSPSDLLAFSSGLLQDLFAEYGPGGELPGWCREITWDEYRDGKNDKVKGVLRRLLRNDPGAWSRRGDRLILRLEDVRNLKKDVPADLYDDTPGTTSIDFDAALLDDFLGGLPDELVGQGRRAGLLSRLLGRDANS